MFKLHEIMKIELKPKFEIFIKETIKLAVCENLGKSSDLIMYLMGEK